MPEFNDPILGKVRYTVTREINAICPKCDNPDCAEIEEFKQRVVWDTIWYSIASPEGYESFKMRDLVRWPMRKLLAQMDYLREMFVLEVDNNQSRPIVITLRETSEHFEARQK